MYWKLHLCLFVLMTWHLYTSTGTDIPPPTGDGFETEFLCGSRYRFMVININNTKTTVRVEECINVNSTCNYLDILPNFIESRCVQTYLRQKVGGGNNTKSEYINLPSACKCAIDRKYNVDYIF